MALPLIPIISGLTAIAPSIAKWLGGNKAEAAAQEVADLARIVTGQNDVGQAVQIIQQDQKSQLEFLKLLEQNKTKLDELYLADTQNAREMYGKHNEQADRISERITRFNIIYVVLVALAQILAITLTDLPDSAVVVIGNVCGWIIKGLLDERIQVCNFYFGSSIGSKSKR